MTRTTRHQNDNAPDSSTSGGGTFVYLATAVAAVGGFLFGFDTAIIGGAIGFIKEQFQLGSTEVGIAVSSVLVGCMVGASVAGALSDWLGRKRILITAAVLFLATAILAAVPRTLPQLVCARFLTGLAVGVDSVLSPLYIAELAPARIRGRLVTLNQVAIGIGAVCAYVIGLAFAGLSPLVNWRWMFASGAVPAAVFLTALVRIPESPRWLTKQGRVDEALDVLTRVDGEAHAQSEMADIVEAIAHEGGSVLQLLQPGLRVALLIGILLAIFQQITGINTITYYAPEIFKSAGFPVRQALVISIVVAVVSLFANTAAASIVDRLGRRSLFLGGTSGMPVFLGLIGWSFYSSAFPRVATAVFVLGYVACFSLGLGPGVWTILSEIFPTRIRGRAMGICTVSVWLSCFVISLTFPVLVERVGAASTFWLYGVMCILAVIFTWLVVPETKGKSLEQIEKLWLRKSADRQS